MTPVVLATRSPHKLREIRGMLDEGLQNLELDLIDLRQAGVPEHPAEDDVEAFTTFEENALAKARYFATHTEHLVLADDSGLCVDALGGGPGVRSRRFSGRSDLSGTALDQANNALLLDRLAGTPAPRRGAHYVCAIALLDRASGREAVVRGACDGMILEAPRGPGGFGYDPLFYLPAEHATFGELRPERKSRISHRAHAVAAAAAVLRDWLRPG